MSAFLRRSGQNPHRWATKGMKSKKELLAKKKHTKRKSAKAKHNRVLGIHNPMRLVPISALPRSISRCLQTDWK
jgi:hypothetical protein